jgi:hypothetical protein
MDSKARALPALKEGAVAKPTAIAILTAARMIQTSSSHGPPEGAQSLRPSIWFSPRRFSSRETAASLSRRERKRAALSRDPL